MNAKIATLIAVETGMLLGMISWLGYSHFQSSEPEIAEAPQVNVAPLRMVNAQPDTTNQHPYPATYSANPQQPASLAQLQPAPVPEGYYQPVYQPVVTQPYVASESDTGSVTASSPTYSDAVEDSAVAPVDYVAPPPVIYYAPAAVQNVIFANTHSFRNRCRSTSHSNGDPMKHQSPDRRNFQQNPSVVEPPRSVVPSAVQPTEVSRPRPNSIRSDKIASSPRRPFLPLSSRPMRSAYSAP